MTLKTVIQKDESGGYWAEVPSLPGCVSQGESVEEVRVNIREAIEAWLEAGEPEDVRENEVIEIAV